MSIINLLVAAGRAVREFRQRQRAYADLGRLDDRSLADIGLRRSDIPAIVEGFYPGTRAHQPEDRREKRAAAFDPHQARAVAGHRWVPPI